MGAKPPGLKQKMASEGSNLERAETSGNQSDWLAHITASCVLI